MTPSTAPTALLVTLLTLVVFSRAWGPNLAFRWVAHLLLGLLAGYVAAVAVRTVLWPGLIAPLLDPAAAGPWLWVIAGLGLLLAFRFTADPRWQNLGLLPIGLVAGAGAGLALAGALRGTLVPQLLALGQADLLPGAPGWANSLAAVLSTVVTVGVIFHFQQRPGRDERPLPHVLPRPLAILADAGYLALMIALGALLAATAGARLTLLIDRVHFLISLWTGS
jgi:hypothetical protein